MRYPRQITVNDEPFRSRDRVRTSSAEIRLSTPVNSGLPSHPAPARYSPDNPDCASKRRCSKTSAAVTTTAQRRRPVAASANGEARRRATSPVIKSIRLEDLSKLTQGQLYQYNETFVPTAAPVRR